MKIGGGGRTTTSPASKAYAKRISALELPAATGGCAGPVPAEAAARRRPLPAALLVADGEHLELADAARRLDLDRVAFGLADQRPRDRRADRDLAVLQIRLVVTDDLVGHTLAGRAVLELDSCAEYDVAARIRDRGRIDHLRAREPVLDLGDPPFDEPLALLR